MRRPIYLLIALVAMWILGMDAAANGYVVVKVIHSPLSVPMSGTGKEAVTAAMVHAIIQRPRVNLPIGLAQILLGGLLVLVSLKALVSRHASTSFALQVLAANAVLVVVTYALREPVRVAAVNALATAKLTPRPPSLSAAEFTRLQGAASWWILRALLGLHLAALGLCGFALTRKTARAVLAAAPRSEGH